MISCIIDGKAAFPEVKENIKVTLENPYIKEQGEYTFDIVFPLDIPENIAVFGPVGRVDVMKGRRIYEDCRLMCSNRTVIQGTGTVTGITRDEVKMQILSGSSSVRYRSDFQQIYIDRLDYPDVPAKYKGNCVKWHGRIANMIDVDAEIRNKRYIGDIHRAVFMPVWDESNGCIANDIVIGTEDITGSSFVSGDATFYLFNRAVQPNLMMVVSTVLQHMGYTVSHNDYDMTPWNELVICSARQTAIIANALPHWTVKTFLDEFRKLFNAALLFDEGMKTVRIVRANTAPEAETADYEMADGFETDYDEDGVEYIGSSNLQYRLSGLGDLTWEIPQEVISSFTVREYDSHDALVSAFNAMTDEEKLTTLMVDPEGFVYAYEVRNSEGEKTGGIDLKRTGWFTQLTRNISDSHAIELLMCPVALANRKYKWKLMRLGSGQYDHVDDIMATCWLPVIENAVSEVGPLDEHDVPVDEQERGYVTIEEVIDQGESASGESQEESSTIQLMWPAAATMHPVDGTNVILTEVPVSMTDWRFGPTAWSSSLALTHAGSRPSIAQFHETACKIGAGGNIDANNLVRIPFLFAGKPDPTKMYVFRNKRFLCAKVEMSIDHTGIDDLKVGYFYEVLS